MKPPARLLLVLACSACVTSACAPGGGEIVSAAAVRVTATPIPTPEPTPIPKRIFPESDVDRFENSGGRIRWEPQRNAGPWPTAATIELPTLGQSAPIVRVGVNSRQEMQVPGNARDVGWLDQGGWPGQTQNPVLAGHIAYGGRAGTFNQLQTIGVGDPVHVTMDGVRYTYSVIWVRAYDRNTPHVEKIMGYTEVPSITLITCGGTFDRRAGTHSKRIVARAQLVSAA
ncbi:MAG TPA: class F sortase [Actinomycetota bacterium]|nr:class F sortase [Actinomycetota bacterium]